MKAGGNLKLQDHLERLHHAEAAPTLTPPTSSASLVEPTANKINASTIRDKYSGPAADMYRQELDEKSGTKSRKSNLHINTADDESDHDPFSTGNTDAPSNTAKSKWEQFTPLSAAKEIANRFHEYAHVANTNRTDSQTKHKQWSMSVLNLRSPTGGTNSSSTPTGGSSNDSHSNNLPTTAMEMVPKIIAMVLEDFIGILPRGSTWQQCAAHLCLLLSALFLLVVVAARSYLTRFLWTTLIVVVIPSVAILALCMLMAHFMFQNRQSAFPSAKLVKLQRLRSERMDATDAFDLYLPVASRDATPKVVPGLVLLPGALVDHTAYAPLAAHLSDQGIVVAVLSLEPLRFATKHHGAGPENVLPIFYRLVSHHSDTFQVNDWAIGGHSAGGSSAFNIIRDLNLHKLVLLASSNPAEKHGSLQTLTGTKELQVLCVDATNDTFLQAAQSKSSCTTFRNTCLPSNTQYITIEGGNHAGFGHYGPQTFPMVDGKRSIPLSEQQRQTVESVARFLLEDPDWTVEGMEYDDSEHAVDEVTDTDSGKQKAE